MIRIVALVTALLPAALPAAAQAPDPAWPEAMYNPVPRPADLVLPMPCGGAMVFRPVAVPAEGVLADRRVLLGAEDPDRGYAEMPRYAHLAGGFADPDSPARRVYWIGAYEVTRTQWAAVTGGQPGSDEAVGDPAAACPDPDMAGRRPATGVTWFEALAFAEAYTRWLYETAPDALPREEGTPGFLRPATEAEWEYAARGGIAVPGEVFRERVFPMPEGMADYVWFQGSQSASGSLHPVGLLRANPLGLHDMLGNAAEIVLEPFRLNRLGRLHGLAGGFVIKGGSFRTPRRSIRTAFRIELPHFSGTGPNRLEDVGLRLVIGAPVLTSDARIRAIREELAALERGAGADGDRAGPAADTTADVLADLGGLAAETEEAALRRRLERVVVALRGIAEARDARARQAANSLIRLGAFLGGTIRNDLAGIAMRRRISAAFEAAGSDPDLAERARQGLALAEAGLQDTFEVYVDNAIAAAGAFEPEALRGQLEVVAVELEARNRGQLVPLARLFTRHAAAFRAAGTVDREAWLDDLAGN
jgi:hypothetical protein